MTRVKRGVTAGARHKRLFARNKGFRMTRHRLVKVAKSADLHAGEHAFAGRKNRKRDMRSLWITRISEAVKPYDLSYSKFIHLLSVNNIQLNRKILAFLVNQHPGVFAEVVKKVKN